MAAPAGDTLSFPRERVEGLPTPTLVVRLDRVRANLDRMRGYLGGDLDRWRPHLKTTKLPVVWAELLAAGIRRFKCATVKEAKALLRTAVEAGVDDPDLLIAYPQLGPALAVAGDLAREHPRARLACLLEDPLATGTPPPGLDLFVDLNVGMDRTGIPLADEDRIVAACRAAGTAWRGLHAYEGHITGGDAASRRRRCHETYDRLVAACLRLGEAGLAPPEVITSGTPGFRHALAHPGLRQFRHTVSPGTVIFHDDRSATEVEELDLTPAALVLSRVISHPAADRITLDAGSKAISAEGDGPCCRVLGHPDLHPLTPSEEHLPLRCTGPDRPPRGTLLTLLPRHICTTVNLADGALVLDGNQSLGVHPIAARGHDLPA